MGREEKLFIQDRSLCRGQTSRRLSQASGSSLESVEFKPHTGTPVLGSNTRMMGSLSWFEDQQGLRKAYKKPKFCSQRVWTQACFAHSQSQHTDNNLGFWLAFQVHPKSAPGSCSRPSWTPLRRRLLLTMGVCKLAGNRGSSDPGLASDQSRGSHCQLKQPCKHAGVELFQGGDHSAGEPCVYEGGGGTLRGGTPISL